MNFSDLFNTSIRLLTHERRLWVLGLVLVLCGQSGHAPGFTPFVDPAPIMQGELQPLYGALLHVGTLTWSLLALGLLVLALAQIVVGALVHGALILVTVGAQTGAPLTLGAALRAAWARTRTLALIRLLVGVSLLTPVLAVLALAIGLVVALALNAGLDAGLDSTLRFLLIGLACLLVPLFGVAAVLGLVLGWIEALALRACVLDTLGVRAALRRAWQRTRARFIHVFLTWGMVAALGSVIGWIVGPIFSLLSSAWFTALLYSRPQTLGTTLAVGLAIALSACAGGALGVFESVLWTGLYRMTSEAAA